jgi:hypothetical protein
MTVANETSISAPSKISGLDVVIKDTTAQVIHMVLNVLEGKEMNATLSSFMYSSPNSTRNTRFEDLISCVEKQQKCSSVLSHFIYVISNRQTSPAIHKQFLNGDTKLMELMQCETTNNSSTCPTLWNGIIASFMNISSNINGTSFNPGWIRNTLRCFVNGDRCGDLVCQYIQNLSNGTLDVCTPEFNLGTLINCFTGRLNSSKCDEQAIKFIHLLVEIPKVVLNGTAILKGINLELLPGCALNGTNCDLIFNEIFADLSTDIIKVLTQLDQVMSVDTLTEVKNCQKTLTCHRIIPELLKRIINGSTIFNLKDEDLARFTQNSLECVFNGKQCDQLLNEIVFTLSGGDSTLNLQGFDITKAVSCFMDGNISDCEHVTIHLVSFITWTMQNNSVVQGLIRTGQQVFKCLANENECQDFKNTFLSEVLKVGRLLLTSKDSIIGGFDVIGFARPMLGKMVKETD